MPTYRKSTIYTDSSAEDKYALGVIQSNAEFFRLNEFLKMHKLHIIVKPHPLQLLDGQFLTSVSNIHYIVNEQLFKKQILLYELIGCCDALLTDFSSVFFDYLVLNRPVAFFMNDFEKYDRGFIMDNPFDYMPGEKIYHLNDLYLFLQNVVRESDQYHEERTRVNGLVNFSDRPDNAQCFVQYMMREDKTV